MEVTWEKSGGVEETFEFGDCTTYVTSTETLTIASEAMHYNVNWRSDDVDGWAMQDYLQWRDNDASHCQGLGNMEDQVDDPLCWYDVGSQRSSRLLDDW